MLTAHIIFSGSDEIAPLYCQYPLQYRPQPAYVTLDLTTGAVDAEYSTESGGATTIDVIRNRTLQWKINPELSGAEVYSILESYLPAFQSIIDGSEINWNGKDLVGEQVTDQAKAYKEQLDRDSDYMFGDSTESTLITDLANFLQEGGRNCWMPNPSDDVKTFIKNIGLDEYRILENPTDVLNKLWANELYEGKSLPANVAQYLIATGVCEDSSWVEELESFATTTSNN